MDENEMQEPQVVPELTSDDFNVLRTEPLVSGQPEQPPPESTVPEPEQDGAPGFMELLDVILGVAGDG